MEYVVEFIGHDGRVRRTRPMGRLSAEIAKSAMPFECRIIPVGRNEDNDGSLIVGELTADDIINNPDFKL